jgi:hypothetical protein
MLVRNFVIYMFSIFTVCQRAVFKVLVKEQQPRCRLSSGHHQRTWLHVAVSARPTRYSFVKKTVIQALCASRLGLQVFKLLLCCPLFFNVDLL